MVEAAAVKNALSESIMSKCITHTASTALKKDYAAMFIA